MQETLLADSVFSALEFVKEWLPRFERLIVHEDRLLIICTFYAINYWLDIMEKEQKALPLTRPLKFWYQRFVKGEDRFEDSLHPLADIATVE